MATDKKLGLGTCMLLFGLVCVHVGITHVAAAADDISFVESVADFQSGKTRLTAEEKALAREKEYVLVKGFVPRMISGYYKNQKAALVALGIPKKQIHIFLMPSYRSIEDNIRPLKNKIEALTEFGKRKIVLIGHSKGASEALAMMYFYRRFTREHIDSAFFIQGAFGGSPIADVLEGKEQQTNQIANSIPWFRRAALIGLFVSVAVAHPFISSGLHSLQTNVAPKLWDSIAEHRKNRIGDFFDQIRFIRAAEHPSRHSRRIRAAGWYVFELYGENDGVVRVGDQLVAGLGRDMGVLPADHLDLVSAGSSNQGSAIRYALTQAIVREAVGVGR